MSENKFTPGPWNIAPNPNYPDTIMLNGSAGYMLVDATGFDHRCNPADLALMVASPELIAACRAALALIRDPDAEAPDADRVEKILEAAIRKARGE